jgi:hypothetical protein
MTEAQEWQVWRNFTHAYLTAIAQGTLIPETEFTTKGFVPCTQETGGQTKLQSSSRNGSAIPTSLPDNAALPSQTP